MYEIIGNGENVNSQMPMAKSKIYKKSGKIILYTGNDTPNNVVIPNVVGLSPEEANQLLVNSGLNIRINGAENFAYGDGAEVVAQFPSSGISVEIGTVVSIEILFTDESE
jgi:stage V sporulation protein D (sporulation-specific penicillin-binding protein)